MNLADYLSELLGQHDEVSLPGLGYFVRTRVNAFYNDSESRFYPPYHQVKFVPQLKDDDVFTQYIADKKNISLASSKYFTEKFISKLKEDAESGKYLFADLGSFYTEHDQLVFKPNNKIPSDPAFYGYSPVSIDRVGQPLSPGTAKPVFTETAATQQAGDQATEQQQYLEGEEETAPRRMLSAWLIALIALVVVAFAVFGIYKFYPATFKQMGAAYHKIIGAPVSAPPHKAKINTVKKVVPPPDTAAKTVVPIATPVADTTPAPRWEVIANHFSKLARANANVQYFKSRGINAKIVLDAPGPFLKVSVGTYATQSEAQSAMLEMIKAHKISSRSQLLEILPKKN